MSAMTENVPYPNAELNSRPHLIIIDRNALILSCLSKVMAQYHVDFVVEAYASIDDWQSAGIEDRDQVVMLCFRGRNGGQTTSYDDIARVRAASRRARVIIVSDVEASSHVVCALNLGACGYIPESANLDVAAAAISLVRAGGTYVPAGSLMAGAEPVPPPEAAANDLPFTDRQLAVIERLRLGESNKIIALNLNMQECTVKVHVRNIMNKIKARNRTEIAFLTNHMFRRPKTPGTPSPVLLTGIDERKAPNPPSLETSRAAMTTGIPA